MVQRAISLKRIEETGEKRNLRPKKLSIADEQQLTQNVSVIHINEGKQAKKGTLKTSGNWSASQKIQKVDFLKY